MKRIKGGKYINKLKRYIGKQHTAQPNIASLSYPLHIIKKGVKGYDGAYIKIFQLHKSFLAK